MPRNVKQNMFLQNLNFLCWACFSTWYHRRWQKVARSTWKVGLRYYSSPFRFLSTRCGRTYPNLLSATLRLCLGPVAGWPACVICISRSSHTTSTLIRFTKELSLAFWKSESLLFVNTIHEDCVIDLLSTLVLPQSFVLYITLFLLVWCKSAEPWWQREKAKTYQQTKFWKVFAVTSCYKDGRQHLIVTADFCTEVRFFSASFQLPHGLHKV